MKKDPTILSYSYGVWKEESHYIVKCFVTNQMTAFSSKLFGKTVRIIEDRYLHSPLRVLDLFEPFGMRQLKNELTFWVEMTPFTDFIDIYEIVNKNEVCKNSILSVKVRELIEVKDSYDLIQNCQFIRGYDGFAIYYRGKIYRFNTKQLIEKHFIPLIPTLPEIARDILDYLF